MVSTSSFGMNPGEPRTFGTECILVLFCQPYPENGERLTISQLMAVTPSTAKSNGSTSPPNPARFKNGMMNDPRQQSTCRPILAFFASLPRAGMGSWLSVVESSYHDSKLTTDPSGKLGAEPTIMMVLIFLSTSIRDREKSG